MSGSFGNPIVGGTALRIPAIQSPNYSPGVAGWIIKINGDAEFNNLTIRGEFLGTDFIINAAGIFLYSSTPAAGNLIGSWTSASGTDSFGNTYGSGLTIGLSGKPQVNIDQTSTAGFVLLPTNAAGENVPAEIISTVGNAGTSTENVTLVLRGPSEVTNTDRLSLKLQSEYKDGSIPASVAIDNGLTAARYFSVSTTDILLERNTTVYPNTSSDTALTVESFNGTGDLLHLNVNTTPVTTVDEAGVVNKYASDTFNTYTPTVTGGGTVGFSTQTGRWQRIGKMVFFTAYLVINSAGSGASVVQIDAPSSISRATRQCVNAHTESLTAGNNGSSLAVAFTGGSGATFDRIRNSTNASITGADLLNGGIITVEGWYREA